jgi:DNA (cytosine-5)-methyltransferase 1
MPEMTARADEEWHEHDARLGRDGGDYRHGGHLHYRVRHRLMQAADFGVPQQRERVFIVAYRSDLDRVWEPPQPSHSLERLLYEQWVDGSYWPSHAIRRPRVPETLRPTVESLRNVLLAPAEHRWRTVRDALNGLPKPATRNGYEHEASGVCLACHFGNPGARRYKGHDGSSPDWPAKTLKAGVHGVPGGENMLRNANGTVRYFTPREAARLQSFSDAYHFPGSWGETFRQLGNAVPVSLARMIGEQIASALASPQRVERADRPLSVA